MNKPELQVVCDKHGPREGPTSYVDWHAWAEKQKAKGRKQVFCMSCRLYYWEPQYREDSDK